MKASVFWVLLVQALNAQVVPPDADPAPSSDSAPIGDAPVAAAATSTDVGGIIPSPAADLDTLPSDLPSVDLLVGTADVILSTLEPSAPSLGAGVPSAPGIDDGSIPLPSATAGLGSRPAFSSPPRPIVDSLVNALPTLPAPRPLGAVGKAGVSSSSAAPRLGGFGQAAVKPNVGGGLPAVAPPGALGASEPSPPVLSPSPVGFAGGRVPPQPGAATPVRAPPGPSKPATGPSPGGPSSPAFGKAPTPSPPLGKAPASAPASGVGKLSGLSVGDSGSPGSSPGLSGLSVGAQDFGDQYSSGPSGSDDYEDNGWYDGEDNYDDNDYDHGKKDGKKGHDDDECPKWCLDDDDDSHGKKPKSRRRQENAADPPASHGFNGFAWPAKSGASSPTGAEDAPSPSRAPASAPDGKRKGMSNGKQPSPYANEYPYEDTTDHPYDSPYDQNDDYDDMGDDDLPDWLKKMKGKKGKGKCPKKCKKPTKTSTKASTRKPTSTHRSKPTHKSWPSRTARPTRTHKPWYSKTSTTSEDESSTADPFGPTTLITTTTTTVDVGPTATGHDVNEGDTWVGSTIADVCPKTCNPFNPAENKCDSSSTGCTTSGGKPYYCACRAGYRLDNTNAKNYFKQIKVPGQPYVYVAPEVSGQCNTICDDSLCSEVMERPHCLN